MKKILFYTAYFIFAIALIFLFFLFISKMTALPPKKDAIKPDEAPQNPGISFDFFVGELAAKEFKAEVVYNGKKLGVYKQKGENIRIDFPDESKSYLYIAGLKKHILLDHKKKVAKELFSTKETTYYFNLYALFLPYYQFSWQEKYEDLWVAEDKEFKVVAELKGPEKLLSSIKKIKKNSGQVVEEIKLKYLSTGGLNNNDFFIPKDYRYIDMYHKENL